MQTSTPPQEISFGPIPANLIVVETFLRSFLFDPTGASYFELDRSPPGEDVAWVRAKEPVIQQILQTAFGNRHRVKLWISLPRFKAPDGRLALTAYATQLFVD